MKRPRVEFRSGGPSGNIMHILALVRKALLKEHRVSDFNEIVDAAETGDKDYTEMLAFIREKVDLVDLDGKF